MDNTLGFDEDKNIESEEEWQTGIQSVTSLTAESQQSISQQNLYIIPQKTVALERSIIPATLMEKLAFYRAFTSASSKIEMMCMQQSSVNRFTWFYISNVICKSLPMTYVYIFLSSYAPDYHFYIPKMVPICLGFNWIFLMAGLFLLQTSCYNIALQIHYAIYGLVYKIPWNRCVNRHKYYKGWNYTCLDLSEFSTKFVTNITYMEGVYVSPSNEFFTLAQIEYFDDFLTESPCLLGIRQCTLTIIKFVIWIVAAVLYKQLFKRYIWKILHYTQMMLCILLLMILINLLASDEESQIQVIKAGEDDIHREILMDADFDLLAESMVAPPVAHLISSRTTNEIRPSLSSAVIVISNGIYYIFKGLTSYFMKRYCERWVNATIIYWNYGSGSYFYFWPIYFATIKYGAVFAVIFFFLNAVVEYCTFLISFQCLVEAITCEWQVLKPWCTSAMILLLAILEIIYLGENYCENCFVFWIGLSSLAEILIIFWVYSAGRLVDDITFHSGFPPTKLRMWSFYFLPIFYLNKIYIMLHKFYLFSGLYSYFQALHNTRSAPTYILALFVLGAVYSVYKYVIKGKKHFSSLFKPVPEWGPKEYRTRQLRKQFDFREVC